MTTWLDTHSADPTQRRHLLLEIDFATPVRWTDCPLPIAYDGHMWTPKATTVTGITSRQLDGASATLEVANADNLMSGLFFSGGAADKVVSIWVACFDIASTSQIPQQVVLIFQGKIDTLVITNSGTTATASITLGPPSQPTAMMLPMRKMVDLLRHT
jgi:hypothetical protein